MKYLSNAAPRSGMVEFIDSLGEEGFRQQFADSPQLLSFLEANFVGEANAEARDSLFESTDESPFSLRQWIEALRAVRAWLDARSLEMAITDEIGYVSCAGASAGSGANLESLPAIVAEMLDAYGCERAVKKS